MCCLDCSLTVCSIRHPYEDPTPPTYFTDYLNLASTQDALGVNLNYTESNDDVYYAFQQTGDFVYPNFLTDLEMILNNSVRVAMYHGDADYICNWFGGQAVSLQIDYIHSAEFRAAGYAPFVVDGIEYGEVRQYGNYSFTRIYEAGHEVPFYQPIAALAMFSRVLGNVDLATGEKVVKGSYETNGTVNATRKYISKNSLPILVLKFVRSQDLAREQIDLLYLLDLYCKSVSTLEQQC